jgi:sugar/nucleoside kinase (ribokinase family)
MQPEFDVLVPGRPSCDLVFSSLAAWPELGREVYADGFSAHAGAHFNTAAALARLGLSVAFVAVVGADQWGEMVLRDLRAEGLSDTYVRVLEALPTPVSVALNLAGDRGFVTYAPRHDVSESEFLQLSRDVLGSAEVRHVHADLSAAPGLLAAARRAGASLSVEAYDAGPELASDEVRAVVAAADLVFANEDEATAIGGSWRGLGRISRHAIVKRGARGAVAMVDGDAIEEPALAADVVDATGAGDCFAAGYLWGHLRGLAPETCLPLANFCGAAAVRQVGGYRGALREGDLLEAARSAGLAVHA